MHKDFLLIARTEFTQTVLDGKIAIVTRLGLVVNVPIEYWYASCRVNLRGPVPMGCSRETLVFL